jgi:hypothetical protein
MKKILFWSKEKNSKFLGFGVAAKHNLNIFFKNLIQKHNKTINFKQRKKT